MARDNGGIIGPANNPTSDSASGVWDLPAQYQAISGGNWPPIPTIAENSLRFNRGSSDGLSKTFATNSNRKTFTISAWTKYTPSSNTGARVLFGCTDGGGGYFWFFFNSSGNLYIENTSASLSLGTTQLFRDYSAWYHIIFAVDTTQTTSSNRAKLYVNGIQVTVFDSETYPSLNQDLSLITSTQPLKIGEIFSSNYFDGYMSEVCWIDGQQLDPTSFGQFNANGIWTPIPIGISSFGTNGFHLKFENSASLGLDSSPNGNNFTVNNLTSIDQTTDIPTNNFATANPLHFSVTIPSDGTLSDGNLTFTSSQGASAYPVFYSTMGVSQGKWYTEFKVTTANSAVIGIGSGIPSGGFFGGGLYDYAYYYNGAFYNSGNNTGSQSSYTDGDIISVAMDLDNNKVYVAKNNTWQHSGNPSAGTGGYTITAPSSTDTGVYNIAYGDIGSGTPAIQGNFGNPPFTIASGNSDANGYGNFEYAVPSGYYALNTKNLATYG